MDHFAEAEAWLARGEEAYERFESDQDPRDVSLLRRAETAARFATAHAALAGLTGPQHIAFGPDHVMSTWSAPNGHLIPVSPVHPDGRT